MNISADYRRLLPIEFCRGYINAHKTYLANGPTSANVSKGKETIDYPDHSGFWSLINPYLVYSADRYEVLPYPIVATALIGFLKNEYKPQDDNKWKVKLLQKIGNLWSIPSPN